jgi:hypothetical protein
MAVFAVITKVPDIESGETGNLAMAWPLFTEENNTAKLLPTTASFGLLSPVFDQGEIIVVDDEYGREIGGAGRNPSKWFVECEYFDDVEAAIARSREVMS